MRVHIRISVSGEVFAHGQHTATFQSTTISDHLFSHLLRVFPERTYMDYRVQRIGIDIRIRCKIHMNTQLTKFPCHFTPVFINQMVVFNTAKCSILREIRRTFQAHRESPLTIKSNHNGNFRILLGNIRQYSLLFRCTFSKQQTSYLIFLNQIAYLFLLLFIHFGRKGGNNQLSYFFLQIQTGIYRIYPLFATGICR